MRHPELRVATSRFSSIVIIIIPCFQKKEKGTRWKFLFAKKKRKRKITFKALEISLFEKKEKETLLSKRWKSLFSKKKKNYFQCFGNFSFSKKNYIQSIRNFFFLKKKNYF